MRARGNLLCSFVLTISINKCRKVYWTDRCATCLRRCLGMQIIDKMTRSEIAYERVPNISYGFFNIEETLAKKERHLYA